MSLSNVKVQIYYPGEWIDSLKLKPHYDQEVWVCNGEGGKVSPARYCGLASDCYHGLYGELPELRDDHYFWMIRHPGTPPATKKARLPRVIFVADEQDRWVDSRVAIPDVGDVVWMDDLIVGPQVVRFKEIDLPPHPVTGVPSWECSAYPPVFYSIDGSHKYVGYRYWAPITSPKRPFV